MFRLKSRKKYASIVYDVVKLWIHRITSKGALDKTTEAASSGALINLSVPSLVQKCWGSLLLLAERIVPNGSVVEKFQAFRT